MTPLQAAHGLYDASYEHDACGVAFVARLRAPASNEVVSCALSALEHMEHRGAEGADPDTGDGAGILLQIPDAFLRDEVDFELPPAGRYGVAMCFLPPGNPAEAMRLLEETRRGRGPARARLARRAGGRGRLRDDGAIGGAEDRPAVHRRGRIGRATRTRSSAGCT